MFRTFSIFTLLGSGPSSLRQLATCCLSYKLVFFVDPSPFHQQEKDVRQWVSLFFQERQDARMVWMREALSERLAELTEQLGMATGLAGAPLAAAIMLARVYPLGLIINERHPLAACLREIQKIPALREFPEFKSVDAIPPLSIALIDDAFAIASWLDTEGPELRQLQNTLITGQQSDPITTSRQTLDQLLRFRFATSAARQLYQPVLGQRIASYAARLEKHTRQKNFEKSVQQPEIKHSHESASFAGLEPQPPVRLIQTFFRTVFRNHIHLSAIADNKAHIMISVNAILISVLISFASYRNLAETRPVILLPVVIFLVTGLASLVSAVLAAWPRVTGTSNGRQSTQPNIAFFGGFVRLSKDSFTRLLAKNLRDSSLLYENLTHDLYSLGQVLDKKYRYLSVSYKIFISGLIATVLAFLLSLL